MKYNKLIRDYIPAILNTKQLKVTSYICDEKEYEQRLRDKLQEEVNEFLQDDTVEELTDILEVVYTLARTKGITKNELELLRHEKALEHGGFKKRIVLLEVVKEKVHEKRNN